MSSKHPTKTLQNYFGIIFNIKICVDDKENPSIPEKQLKQDLESAKDPVKIAAMKSVLAQMLNGKNNRIYLRDVTLFIIADNLLCSPAIQTSNGSKQ